MSYVFHEHHDAIMRWSWKLFCAKWVRLIAAFDQQRKTEQKQREDAEFEKLRMVHEAHAGGVVGVGGGGV